jgi:hypothetical protein
VSKAIAASRATPRSVRPVGVDLELDDFLVEPDDRTGVVTGSPRLRLEHDDAVVVVTDAELAGGADHPR